MLKGVVQHADVMKFLPTEENLNIIKADFLPTLSHEVWGEG
jgi:hypothetical protein